MVQIHKCSSNWLWEKFNLSVATCFVFKKLDNFDPSPALLDASSFMSMCCCYFTSSAYQVFSASKYSFLNLRPFSLNYATLKMFMIRPVGRVFVLGGQFAPKVRRFQLRVWGALKAPQRVQGRALVGVRGGTPGSSAISQF